nr:hypothetical protein [Tanacetum cinerariifolium]
IENQYDLNPVVKVTLCLGSEKHAIEYQDGIISDQLVFVKGDKNAQRLMVTRTNVKPPTLAAYTGVVPLIAKICQPGNWKKKKKASLEKSQEIWKREFFTGRKM